MTEAKDAAALTDARFWDAYWDGTGLPVVVDESRTYPYTREILRVFKRWVPSGEDLATLEIGGAPGGYLAYVARTFGNRVSAIDISPVGCRMLVENFRLLGIPIDVYCLDALSADLSEIPRFDLVYSLGLIEHFSHPAPMMRRHVELTKPGGLVVVGVPSFLGVNRPLIKLTRPELVASHNFRTMDIRSWHDFESALGLEVLFRGYVGGWEPRLYSVRAKRRLARVVNVPIRVTAKAMDLMKPLRRLNSRAWSGYAMGVYRTPA